MAILIQLAFQVDVPDEHVTKESTLSPVEPSAYFGFDENLTQKLDQFSGGQVKPYRSTVAGLLACCRFDIAFWAGL